LAFLFGLSVALVPLGFVVGGARSRDVRFERAQTRSAFKRFDVLLADFHQKHGRYPATLGALSRDTIDGWGKPLHFCVREGQPFIESLGRDGKRGGMGTDADLSNRNPKPAQGRLPFWTRISDADDLPATAFAVACGVAASLAAFAGLKSERFVFQTWVSLGVRLLGALAIAVVGAILIALANNPSGH